MHTIERNKETHLSDEQQRAEPPSLWRIVLHADVNDEDATTQWVLMHVLWNHVGTSISASTICARTALREGRATVKDKLTQEVGETLMADINSCHRVKVAKRFAFKLEKM